MPSFGTWIKIKDRLPEKNAGTVLIWHKEWGIGSASADAWVMGWMDDELRSYGQHPPPTHWMPLPAPPEANHAK
jgi:hypothetical protein